MNELEEKWLLAQEAARVLVSDYRTRLGKGVEVYALSVGSDSSDTDTRFSRKGTSTQSRLYTLPPALESLVTAAYQQSFPDASVSSAEQGMLLDVLGRYGAPIPGVNALTEATSIDPTVFQGLSSLLTMSARNPYSSDYESATQALYDRQLNQARAVAQSGPANVRGGQARTGFELGEVDAQAAQNRFRDVRQQQDREAGVVQSAVNIMNTIESMRRGSSISAAGQHQQGQAAQAAQSLQASGNVNTQRGVNLANIQMASELLGSPRTTVRDNLNGRGSQNTQSLSFGAQVNPCCFVFLEALNGKLPWYVRRGRDDFSTPNRRVGYIWTSLFLVPLMQKRGWVKRLVNWFLVTPFVKWGGWLYEKKNPILGRLMKPYCKGWFLVWDKIGEYYGKRFQREE